MDQPWSCSSENRQPHRLTIHSKPMWNIPNSQIKKWERCIDYSTEKKLMSQEIWVCATFQINADFHRGFCTFVLGQKVSFMCSQVSPCFLKEECLWPLEFQELPRWQFFYMVLFPPIFFYKWAMIPLLWNLQILLQAWNCGGTSGMGAICFFIGSLSRARAQIVELRGLWEKAPLLVGVLLWACP